MNRRNRCRIARQRKTNEFLDGAAAEQRSHSFIFAQSILFARMRRPFDSHTSEILQADGRGTLQIGHRVQVDPQTSNGCLFGLIRATVRKHDQALLGECQFARQELTFRSM